MKSKYLILLSIYLFISFSACTKDAKTDIVALAKEYESCCGAEPFEFNVKYDDGEIVYIYVPNVFTPNGDGINDKFFPVVNDEIRSFTAFYIQQEVFDDTTSTIVYSVGEEFKKDSFQTKAWDGKDAKGHLFKGAFSYHITCFTKSGKAFAIMGNACSVLCGEDALKLKDNANCFYGSQANSKGVLVKQQANLEQKCYK